MISLPLRAALVFTITVLLVGYLGKEIDCLKGYSIHGFPMPFGKEWGKTSVGIEQQQDFTVSHDQNKYYLFVKTENKFFGCDPKPNVFYTVAQQENLVTYHLKRITNLTLCIDGGSNDPVSTALIELPSLSNHPTIVAVEESGSIGRYQIKIDNNQIVVDSLASSSLNVSQHQRYQLLPDHLFAVEYPQSVARELERLLTTYTNIPLLENYHEANEISHEENCRGGGETHYSDAVYGYYHSYTGTRICSGKASSYVESYNKPTPFNMSKESAFLGKQSGEHTLQSIFYSTDSLNELYTRIQTSVSIAVKNQFILSQLNESGTTERRLPNWIAF